MASWRVISMRMLWLKALLFVAAFFAFAYLLPFDFPSREKREKTLRKKAGIIQRAMQEYWEDHHKYPPELDSLVPRYLDELPDLGYPKKRIDYVWWQARYGLRPTASKEYEEYTRTLPIRKALTEHRAATGRYPESLDQLVPKFLDAIPHPSTGTWEFGSSQDTYAIYLQSRTVSGGYVINADGVRFDDSL